MRKSLVDTSIVRFLWHHASTINKTSTRMDWKLLFLPLKRCADSASTPTMDLTGRETLKSSVMQFQVNAPVPKILAAKLLLLSIRSMPCRTHLPRHSRLTLITGLTLTTMRANLSTWRASRPFQSPCWSASRTISAFLSLPTSRC